jgi:hypothetical protein
MTNDRPDVTREHLEAGFGKATFDNYVKYFHTTLQDPSMGFDATDESTSALKLGLEGILPPIPYTNYRNRDKHLRGLSSRLQYRAE